MIYPKHLRDLIGTTLKMMDSAYRPVFYSDQAVELLMLTAAQESQCGRYLEQLKGPALGIYQIEPDTYSDLWRNFLMYKSDLADWVASQIRVQTRGEEHFQLKGNLIYQTIIARLLYFRHKEGLPKSPDIPALARYYKKYWNTEKGKATVEEAIVNYRRYC